MSGCHVPTETIEERVKDIEYRLLHIVEFPTEVDIRLQDVERRIDKFAKHKNRQIDENRKISKRVDELEEYLREIKLLYSNPLQQQVWQESISTRLSELEEWTRKDEDIIYERLEKLEGLLDFTKNLLNTKIHLDEKHGTRKKPHKCPLCEGSGVDLLAIHPELKKCNCRGCEGKGILWG